MPTYRPNPNIPQDQRRDLVGRQKTWLEGIVENEDQVRELTGFTAVMQEAVQEEDKKHRR